MGRKGGSQRPAKQVTAGSLQTTIVIERAVGQAEQGHGQETNYDEANRRAGGQDDPYNMRPKAITCGQYFKKWQRALDARAKQWLIVSLPTSQVWFNKTAAKLRSLNPRILPLQAAMARLTPADERRALNAIERCIRRPGAHTIRMHLHMDHERKWVRAVHRLFRCSGCSGKCGLVLIHIKD